MAELNQFEIQVAEVTATGGALQGAGVTIDEIMSTLKEEDVKKVSEALQKLKKMWYVNAIPSLIPNTPDTYFATDKYMREREGWWMGTKFGRKVTREV